MPGVSGVGISFGADRIYDVLNALDLYPEEATMTTRVMFANFGALEAVASLKLMKRLRSEGISAEIYPDAAKMKKQLSFASTAGVPFVAIIGDSELADGTVTVKNMTSGEQSTLSHDAFVEMLKD